MKFFITYFFNFLVFGYSFAFSQGISVFVLKSWVFVFTCIRIYFKVFIFHSVVNLLIVISTTTSSEEIIIICKRLGGVQKLPLSDSTQIVSGKLIFIFFSFKYSSSPSTLSASVHYSSTFSPFQFPNSKPH